ncbi:MAG TPA: hypothetical protein VHE54_03465 [Puia sp.]|nr:hypothetical protein [Puia sp.]
MKKTILASIVLLFSVCFAQAQMVQGDFTFGAGINVGLPTGDFGTINSFGIGAQLQGEYAFSNQLSAVATTGYTDFFGKTFNTGFGSFKAPSLGHIPILVGARFYPAEQIFLGAQIGYGLYTGGGSSSSGFEYRPQVGYNADQFQVILSYDATSVTGGTFGYMGLTGIYKFGGNK